jgi:two-component system response regulator PilR (NtrC family)
LALQRLVGSSTALVQVKERINKVARTMAPVLLSGESGTGKELAALALHANSHRAGGPMVAVNCGAIPENLLEAEFFGVRKGAYTGATHDRDGYFQAARGGTLFLDEIGELPLAMQSKLLRVIQERCVRAVGGTQEEPIDVRIVSATHKRLDAEVQAGRFRQDLFYRLNVIEIHLPALRERLEDLPALCEALIQRITQDSGTAPPRLAPASLAFLATHPFKGNVRELENLLHRALALHEGGELVLDNAAQAAPLSSPQSVPASAARPPATIPQDLQHHLDQQEREILIQVLKDTAFNRTAAAARLGISLRQIRYRMERLNIHSPHDQESGA